MGSLPLPFLAWAAWLALRPPQWAWLDWIITELAAWALTHAGASCAIGRLAPPIPRKPPVQRNAAGLRSIPQSAAGCRTSADSRLRFSPTRWQTRLSLQRLVIAAGRQPCVPRGLRERSMDLAWIGRKAPPTSENPDKKSGVVDGRLDCFFTRQHACPRYKKRDSTRDCYEANGVSTCTRKNGPRQGSQNRLALLHWQRLILCAPAGLSRCRRKGTPSMLAARVFSGLSGRMARPPP